MKVLEILKGVKDNPKLQRNTLLVLIVLMIIFFRSCGRGDKKTIEEQSKNIAALQDSIRTYETKNGDLVSEKLALITEKKNLKDLNSDLSKEIKFLKDNPITVTKFVTKIIHDTVWITPVVDTPNIVFNDDSTIKTVPFTWKDTKQHDEFNYRKLGGSYEIVLDSNDNIKTENFSIDTDELGMSFVTGITENNKDEIEIFIKSDYPGFTPTKIEGALFNPRESDVIKSYFPPKRWGLGVYGGYGFYFDPQNIRFGHGAQLGVGITYNIIQWRGKK